MPQHRMESLPIHPPKQNKPGIKHDKEAILKNENAMSEIEFNTVLNKSSAITQGGQGGGGVGGAVSVGGELNIVTASY